MLFRQVKSWWIDTVINDTSQQFLSDSIRFKVFVKMIKMNKSNKYFQELDHYAVFKDFDNFSIDKSSRTNILIELNFR
jgi:catalase